MNSKKILQFSVIFLLLFLIKSLYNLQIEQGKHFKEIAENNYVRVNRIEPIRGKILDREYNEIVTNIPATNLFVTPSKIKDKQELSNFLQENIDMNSDVFLDILYKSRYRSHREIILKENLEYQQILNISENMDKFSSLTIKSSSVRSYLSENHFTGYVSRINDQEYESKKSEKYGRNDYIGKMGLEKKYEELLRGKIGYNVVQVDARGNNLNLLKHDLQKPAINGANLVLTIDNGLQKLSASLLEQYKKGAIVVMDVKSGAVLTYVSLPTFDQNLFVSGFSQKEWEKISNNPDHPMLDRVIHANYPPGSIYKPIMIGIGLEQKIIDENTRLAKCTGGLNIGNRFFKCWLPSGHGKSNAVEALKYSCDVYFYDLSLKLELATIKDYSQRSFILDPTGIDLINERKGFFPDRNWYKKNYGKYAAIIGPKANISIGQGELSVSPLQMCAFYNALANHGTWKQPYLLSKIISPDFDYQSPPRIERELPFSQKSLAIIDKGLYEVVNGKWGTGHAAQVHGIKVWGKTGSAENHLNKTTHAWFGGYAGKEEPEIAFVILAENAGHGGRIAAPIAQKIISFYYKNYKKSKNE